MNIDEAMAKKINQQVKTIKKLRIYLQWAINRLEVDHYKCDLNSDTECWDDGPVEEHAAIRKANKLL